MSPVSHKSHFCFCPIAQFHLRIDQEIQSKCSLLATKRTTVSVNTQNDVTLIAEPANQGAFANRYFFFIEARHIENAYVQFPVTANRNRAGDRPSHLVSKFFTVESAYGERVQTTTCIHSPICGTRAPTRIE